MSTILNNTFFNIEELLRKFKLNYLNNNELNFNRKDINSNLWSFIKINYSNYVIKNIDNCYIRINKQKVICDNSIQLNQATQFKLIKIFSEVKKKKSFYYLELLRKEPIDVVIKYIDLNDPNLKREGIHQIEKDYENEELRYSIRSILNNIQWVRKIFILMPNQRVRFFKEYNLIKEKIVYVKDKDLLGYESSNSNSFQFRYWKLKEYGVSDNIIVMDDDCFIGNKLEKSDFFYIKNGKIIPLIVTSNFLKMDKKTVENNCELYKKKIEIKKEEQNNDEFFYSKYLTISFILKLFNISHKESIYIPNFTHNAIPLNLKDIKEAYDLISMSKYKYSTLDCLYRISGYLQFQIFLITYTFMKYGRKVNDIPNQYIRLNNCISADYKKYSLFCINKGAGNYSFLNMNIEKIIMEYLFPIPSPYEIVDNSFLNLTFNTVFSLYKNIKINENQLSKMLDKKEFYLFESNIILFFFLIIFKIHLTKNDYN